jgi:predicted ferric reductase
MHIFVVVVLFITVSIHGSFCSIRYTLQTCPTPTSWVWILCGTIIYICNFFYKQVYVKDSDYKIISDDVIRLQLDLSNKYQGKTIWILVPNINIWEWHPFTVVKSNNNDQCCLYIKRRGDWTGSLIELVNHNVSMNLLTNGPYKTLPDDFDLFLFSKYTVLIASGTGITSFLNVINRQNSFRKLTFVVIVRNRSELSLVCNLLENQSVNFIFYITADTKENTENTENVTYHLGRPDFKDLFDIILLKTLFDESNKIPVVFSGSSSVYNTIKRVSLQYDTFHISCL